MGDLLREVQVVEDAYEREYLRDNGFSLHIAKSVTKGDGHTTFNTVWQSKGIAPSTYLAWNPVYALNWSAKVPSEGVVVSLEGEWQPCNRGQAFDIDETGGWVPSQTNGVPGYLCVGKVNYKDPGVAGIHVIVGVQNSDHGYDAIFVDYTALAKNSSARYQPIELATLWYAKGQKTATMVTTAVTNSTTLDLTEPNPSTHEYYYLASYKHDTGDWVTSPMRAALKSPDQPELALMFHNNKTIGRCLGGCGARCDKDPFRHPR